MKKILLLLLVSAPLVSWAQTDDIYYVPKKKELVIKSSGETYFADVESHRTDADVTVEEPETEIYYTDDLSDLTDYRYSRRIIRFRGLRCNLTSNLYLDLKYGGGFRDWLVLDNGYSVDIYPTANNPLFYWGGAGVSLNIWNWNSWHYASSWSYYNHWNCWPHNRYWNHYPSHWHNPGYWHHGYWGGGHIAGNHSYRPSHRMFRNIPSNGSTGRPRNDRSTSVIANRAISAGNMDAGGRSGNREEKREAALKRQQRRKDNAESMRNMQQRMSKERDSRLVPQRRQQSTVSSRGDARYENRTVYRAEVPQVQVQPIVPGSNVNMRTVVLRNSPVDNTQKSNYKERKPFNLAEEYNKPENRRQRKEDTENLKRALAESERRVSQKNRTERKDASAGYNRPSSTSVSVLRNSGVERNDESEKRKPNPRVSFKSTVIEVGGKSSSDVKPVRYKEYENISKSNTVNMNSYKKSSGFEFDYDKPAPWQKSNSNTSNTPSSRVKPAKDASGGKEGSVFGSKGSSRKKSVFGDHSRGSSKKSSASSRSSSSGNSYSRKNSSSSVSGDRSVRSSSYGNSRDNSNRGSATRGGRGR